MTILATLCYLTEDTKVLMLHRNKREKDWHKGKYNGLGGKFMPGEGPEACMLREVQEESGLLPEEWILKGVLNFPLFDGVNDWQCFVYRITRWSGTLQPCHEGTLEWVEESQLLQLNLWQGDRIFLPKVMGSEGWFSGFFRYVEKELVSWELWDYGVPSEKISLKACHCEEA